MIKKVLIKNNYKKHIITLVSFLCMLLMIFNSQTVMSASKNSLKLCVSAILPSLFPFMVASSLFVNSVSSNTFKSLSFALKHLFGISPSGAAALIPGILCGYPIGANCACKLYSNMLISKSEAESLIAFSNNCGPLFIIGAVGGGILHSVNAGIMLYIIHLLNALICGIILKPFTSTGKKNTSVIKSNGVSFTDAVCDSTDAIIKICGFVVIFAVINALAKPLTKLFSKEFNCLFAGALELTNAVELIKNSLPNISAKIIAISGALGWSGLSVHMQVKSIVSKYGLSMKKYYYIRTISVVNSIVLSYLFLKKYSFVVSDGGISMHIMLKILTAFCVIIAVSSVLNELFNVLFIKRKYAQKK